MTSLPLARRPLAVLTTSYPHGEEDSAGTFVAGFCRALVERGQPVEVLCPQGPESLGLKPQGSGLQGSGLRETSEGTGESQGRGTFEGTGESQGRGTLDGTGESQGRGTLDGTGEWQGSGTWRGRGRWLGQVRSRDEEPGISVVRIPYAWPPGLRFLNVSPGAPDSLARSPLLWGPALVFGARLVSTLAIRARSQGYCGVVAHWLLPSALAGVLGAPSLPTLGVAHGSDVHLLHRTPGGALVAQLLLRRAGGLCFVSEDLRRRFGLLLPESLQETLAAKSVVSPMGVPLQATHRDREAARQALGVKGPLILWMGRLVPLKAPGRALGVAAALSSAQPGATQPGAFLRGATIVIAGDGPLAASLRAEAGPLGDRVRFTGFVSGTRKRDLLEAADVLLLTSTTLPDGRTDSLPVVVLEALTAGVPVVATRVGGLGSLDLPASILRLVPDGQTHEVVESLAKAVGHAIATGRLSDHTRQTLCTRFGWDGALPRIVKPLVDLGVLGQGWG